MVSTELLDHYFQDDVNTFDKISDYMEEARLYPTGRHWVNNLLKPSLFVHQFLRTESEPDWLLQWLCLKRMLPYFFSAGHMHYAQYSTWHLLEMRHLLPA